MRCMKLPVEREVAPGELSASLTLREVELEAESVA